MSETRTPNADDAMTEAVVLRQLLALHPIQLTLEELVREVADDPDEFAVKDAVARAVHELGAAGLVHRIGEVVLPSRAALRFDELLD
jgi:hypothetical protein